MAEITMELIKELREKTQVGMMDCKKALQEANGDMEKAIEILRKKGAAVASKRSGKETLQGTLQAKISPDFKSGSLVKINCETDFAAKTKDMQDFADEVCEHILKCCPKVMEGVGQALLEEKLSNKNITIYDRLNDLVAKISECIKVDEFVKFSVQTNGVVNAYIHPGANLGVLVELETDKPVENNIEDLKTLSKDICMHIAVTNPMSISPDDLDPNVVEKELSIIKEQLAASGKPANMIEKIAQGKIGKFYQDVCLLNQNFIKDEKVTIKDLISQYSKKTGLNIVVKNFKRLSIGG
ncbi:translation elongation factor Ts [Candidatus Babeliales bacterium]|nr:translation elongation factor Ts [Candidatus Babeliales bacterium]MCF7899253.1 translation elongation factor Ts [Candidatus Babeliales bacterium]